MKAILLLVTFIFSFATLAQPDHSTKFKIAWAIDGNEYSSSNDKILIAENLLPTPKGWIIRAVKNLVKHSVEVKELELELTSYSNRPVNFIMQAIDQKEDQAAGATKVNLLAFYAVDGLTDDQGTYGHNQASELGEINLLEAGQVGPEQILEAYIKDLKRRIERAKKINLLMQQIEDFSLVKNKENCDV